MTSPVLVTQVTAPAVLGIPRRVFLALLKSRNIPFAKLGRLHVARLDDVLAALGLDTPSASTPQWTPAKLTETLAPKRCRG